MAKKQQAVVPAELTIEGEWEQLKPAPVFTDIVDNESRIEAIESYLDQLYRMLGHIGIPQFIPPKTGDNK